MRNDEGIWYEVCLEEFGNVQAVLAVQVWVPNLDQTHQKSLGWKCNFEGVTSGSYLGAHDHWRDKERMWQAGSGCKVAAYLVQDALIPKMPWSQRAWASSLVQFKWALHHLLTMFSKPLYLSCYILQLLLINKVIHEFSLSLLFIMILSYIST